MEVLRDNPSRARFCPCSSTGSTAGAWPFGLWNVAMTLPFLLEWDFSRSHARDAPPLQQVADSSYRVTRPTGASAPTTQFKAAKPP